MRRDLWLGKSRLSMRQILTRLILKAFNEYDIAVRAEFTARILQAAVTCDPADAGALRLMRDPLSVLSCVSHPSSGTSCHTSAQLWHGKRIIFSPLGWIGHGRA